MPFRLLWIVSVDFFECVSSSAESRYPNICSHSVSSNSLGVWLAPIEVLVGLSDFDLSGGFCPDESWLALDVTPECFVVGVDEVGIGNLHDNFCSCNSAVRSRL